jgi:tRNA threonylcarbamoyladenosine biosynthesis protein TsaB
MNILAIETSGLGGSVATLTDGKLLHELELDADKRSAQALAPAIKQVLDRSGWSPRDVKLVAVTVGPGSFTGLRIGVMTAKAFAYATGAAVLGLSTLEVIANQMPDSIAEIEVVMDAQRKQLFWQRFARDRQGWFQPVTEVMIKDVSVWLTIPAPAQHVAGAALENLRDRLPAGIQIAPRELSFPRASTVGRLAAQKYMSGERGDVWALAPVYHRRSAAEEKKGKG